MFCVWEKFPSIKPTIIVTTTTTNSIHQIQFIMTICNCNFTLCHQNSCCCVCPSLCDYYHHQDDNDDNIQMSNKTNEAHIFSPDKRLSLSSLMMADSNQTSHQRQSKSFNDSIDINDQNHYQQQQNSLMKFNSTFDHPQRKPFFSTDTCYNRIHKQQSSLPLPTLSSVISFDRKNLPSTTTTTMIIILSIITFVSGMSISFFSVTNFEKKIKFNHTVEWSKLPFQVKVNRSSQIK